MIRNRGIRNLFIAVLSMVLLAFLIVVAFSFKVLDNPDYENIAREMIVGRKIKADGSTRSIWNFHTFLDRSVVNIGMFATTDKAYFRNGIQSKHFEQHLGAVAIEMPDKFSTAGLYELEATTLEGTMHPAFRVLHWYADTAPTIIYNHGANQFPFDAIFKSIFDEETLERPLKLNLIVIRTPFHRKSRMELNEGAATLSRFMAIMAVSVRLTENLIQAVRRKGSKTIEVAGISLGGYIANRHHVIYNSATFYVPVIAGTAFAEVYISISSAAPSALRQPQIIRKYLNFASEWKNANNENVFPILARYDDINRIEYQGPSYGNRPVEVWDRGHITTALSVRALRYVFLRHLIKGKNLGMMRE